MTCKCINLYSKEAKEAYLETKISFMKKKGFKATDQNIILALCNNYLKGGKND